MGNKSNNTSAQSGPSAQGGGIATSLEQRGIGQYEARPQATDAGAKGAKDGGASGQGGGKATPLGQRATDTQPQGTSMPLHGTTWLELYIVYRISGHPPPIQQPASSPLSRPTLRQQLHLFTLQVRRCCRQYFHTKHHHLFRAGPAKGKRLLGLGIDTHLAILPFQIPLAEHARRRIAVEVLRSQRHMTATQAEQAIRTHQLCTPRPLLLKGRADWENTSNPPKHHFTQPLPHLGSHTAPLPPTRLMGSISAQGAHTSSTPSASPLTNWGNDFGATNVVAASQHDSGSAAVANHGTHASSTKMSHRCCERQLPAPPTPHHHSKHPRPHHIDTIDTSEHPAIWSSLAKTTRMDTSIGG